MNYEILVVFSRSLEYRIDRFYGFLIKSFLFCTEKLKQMGLK